MLPGGILQAASSRRAARRRLARSSQGIRSTLAPGPVAGSGLDRDAPIESPWAKTSEYPFSQAQVPELYSRQVLTNGSPGWKTVSSGMVTSPSKVARSIQSPARAEWPVGAGCVTAAHPSGWVL